MALAISNGGDSDLMMKLGLTVAIIKSIYKEIDS